MSDSVVKTLDKKINTVKVKPLYEGTFAVGKDKFFNPIGKTDQPPKGTLKLSINPFLIQNGERNILFDAGLGDLFGGETSIETILNNLDEQSVSDYEITDIFISHLHFDHFGGLAHRQNGYWELTFPEAKIWVSKGGWEKLNKNIDQENEVSRDFFHFLDMKGDLEFLPDKSNPTPNVTVKKIGGHTEFHQLLLFEDGDERYLMAGDVIGRRISIKQKFCR
jgi:glyoxylase-like metal-dependent hydrolase (beta-lactamase superfamily II)